MSPKHPSPQQPTTEEQQRLEQRVGHLHFKQRFGIETERRARLIGQGVKLLNIENWGSMHQLIRTCLKLSFSYKRAKKNVLNIAITHNLLPIYRLPAGLEGLRLLHLSDLHLDLLPEMANSLIASINQVDYDLCVITGDYRAKTYGDYSAAINGMKKVRPHIKAPIYSVLGNHDSILMTTALEAMGIRLLMNEHVAIKQNSCTIWLAGIDDPHYFRADNIEKASSEIPATAPSILLSHTPEIYKHAAYAAFDAMLCGHTHGGQICLPGGKPLYCNVTCPHRYCSGSWKYHRMMGYTSRGAGASLVEARINCPAEITVHHLCNTSSP
ncbi:MAG TPA: metallophosphoesterase [Chromatiales bacterium]|nr:metallophosphoesterase [Chromatiales bacterium]